MASINDIKDFYDYRNDKVQNFGYMFNVIHPRDNLNRSVEVYASSLITAKERLKSDIGNDFIIEEDTYS